MTRSILRQKAKEAYKNAAKGVPKNQRMPFAKFYKNFVNAQKNTNDFAKEEEDFDLENIINVNDITEEDKEQE